MEKKVDIIFIYCLLLAVFPKIICSLTIAGLLFVLFFCDNDNAVQELFSGNRKMMTTFILFILTFAAVIFLALSNSFL